MPDNFEIAHLWIFWLAPLPVLIYWLIPPFRMKSAALIIPDFTRAQQYTNQKPRATAMIRRRNVFIWMGLTLVWISLLASLASPQLVGEPEMKVKTSRNFLIVADISFSMAQKDWDLEGQKVRRWDAVKDVIHDFIDKREGDRMGLIFFGSSAYIQAPFTPDLDIVDQMLEEADVGMAGQMTNIGKAIVKGIDMFDRDTIESKVMLVITDGVDAGTDVLPLDAADLAQKDSILIYTIGIGNPGTSGSDLDEKTLQEISSMTNAQYFRGSDTERLEEIYQELDKLEPIEYEQEEYVPRTLLYYYPLVLAIGLSIIMMLIAGSANLFMKLRTKQRLVSDQ